MRRFDQIASNCRLVVGNSAQTSGYEMSFRRLTSGYGVEPREYTDWDTFFALPTAGAHNESFDESRGGYKVSYTSRFRAADDSPSPNLKQGDQVRDKDGIVSAVIGVSSSGPGTVAYATARDQGLLADADRKGGV